MSLQTLVNLFAESEGGPSLIDSSVAAGRVKILNLTDLPGGAVDLAIIDHTADLTPTPTYTQSRVSRWGQTATDRHLARLSTVKQVYLTPFMGGAVCLHTENFYRAQDPIYYAAAFPDADFLAKFSEWMDFAKNVSRGGTIPISGKLTLSSFEDEEALNETELVDRFAMLFGGRARRLLFRGTAVNGEYRDYMHLTNSGLALFETRWSGASSTSDLHHKVLCSGLPSNLTYANMLKATVAPLLTVNIHFHDPGGPGLVFDEPVNGCQLKVYFSDKTDYHSMGALSTIPDVQATVGRVVRGLNAIQFGPEPFVPTTYFPFACGYSTSDRTPLPLPFRWLVYPSLAAEFGLMFYPTTEWADAAENEPVISFPPRSLSIQATQQSLRTAIVTGISEKGYIPTAAQQTAIDDLDTTNVLVYTCAPIAAQLDAISRKSVAHRFGTRLLIDGALPPANATSEMDNLALWDGGTQSPHRFTDVPSDAYIFEVASVYDAIGMQISTGPFPGLPNWVYTDVFVDGMAVHFNPTTSMIYLRHAGEADVEVSSTVLVLLLQYRKAINVVVTVETDPADFGLLVTTWQLLFDAFEGTANATSISTFLKTYQVDAISGKPLATFGGVTEMSAGRVWYYSPESGLADEPTLDYQTREIRDVLRRELCISFKMQPQLHGYGRMILRTMPKLTEV